MLKEGSLAWSNCYEHSAQGSDFADAIELLGTEQSALSALTTHSVSLDEIGRGFEIASDKQAGAVKVTGVP